MVLQAAWQCILRWHSAGNRSGTSARSDFRIQEERWPRTQAISIYVWIKSEIRDAVKAQRNPPG